MKIYQVTVGIDVSKAKLDIRFVFDPTCKQHQHLIVSNDATGIKSILSVLTKKKVDLSQVLFCFENTGLYSMPLALFFSEKKIDYWEVPALEIMKSKGITRGKSDKNDAMQIAFYAITHIHKLVLSSVPEKDIMRLQLLNTEREKLLKARVIMDSSKEVNGFIPGSITKETLTINKKIIAELTNAIKKIDATILKIIESNEQISKVYKLCKSVPGVGPQTAIYLIIKTRCFTKFGSWRKLACYAGIVPFEYSSGTSLKGKKKVSHLADKKMKSLLNMAALSAKKNDKEIGDYYKRKVAEGKHKMLVQNNIRCKVLSRIFAVVTRESAWVDTQKFAA